MFRSTNSATTIYSPYSPTRLPKSISTTSLESKTSFSNHSREMISSPTFSSPYYSVQEFHIRRIQFRKNVLETNIVVIHDQIPQRISLSNLPLPRSRHDSFSRHHRPLFYAMLLSFNKRTLFYKLAFCRASFFSEQNAKIKENIQIRAKSDSKSAAVCIRCGGITTRAQQLFSPKLTICSTCLFIFITVVYSLSSWRSSRDRCIVRSERSKTSLGACRRTGGSFDSIFRGRSSHPKRV